MVAAQSMKSVKINVVFKFPLHSTLWIAGKFHNIVTVNLGSCHHQRALKDIFVIKISAYNSEILKFVIFRQLPDSEECLTTDGNHYFFSLVSLCVKCMTVEIIDHGMRNSFLTWSLNF